MSPFEYTACGGVGEVFDGAAAVKWAATRDALKAPE
jgi:hypothetical protein